MCLLRRPVVVSLIASAILLTGFKNRFFEVKGSIVVEFQKWYFGAVLPMSKLQSGLMSLVLPWFLRKWCMAGKNARLLQDGELLSCETIHTKACFLTLGQY